MKRKSLAVLFVIALILPAILLTVPMVAAETTDITCDIDPSSGPVGTLVTVSGKIYPIAEGHTINVYWEDTLTPAALVCSDDTDASGAYECTFTVMADVKGDHPVIAVDMDTGDTPLASCGRTFEIKPLIELCPLCGECSTDVTAAGTGFAGDIGILWGTPGWDTTPDQGSVHTSASGSWSLEFHVDELDPGVYEFRAGVASAKFMVGPVLFLDRSHGQPCEDIEVQGCLPGLEPGTTVYIYFEPTILVGTTVISKSCGYFEGTFHVPEVPGGCYIVTATDDDGEVSAEAEFCVCPCISIDPVDGQVGDTITVSGSGYAPNFEVTVWMSGLVPTVVPLEPLGYDIPDMVNLVWAWDETDTWTILTVGWWMPVTTTTAESDGTFTATFEIPQCWGGYHPIVATQGDIFFDGVANVIGPWEIFYECPVFPDGILFTWKSLVVNKPGILRVLPKIWTDPESGVSGQTITLYGTGLSAFEFYVRYTDLCHDYCPDVICDCAGEIYVYKRFSGFVLDFGPNKRWINGPYFPEMHLDYGIGHFILNGQFDGAWSRESWHGPPWERYSPLMLNPYGSLVSDGKSYNIQLDIDYFDDPCLDFCDRFECSFTFSWEYSQIGCPFLTVPWLQPQSCELVAYRFDYIEIEFHAEWPEEDIVDLSLEFFTYDYDETATACFDIEPLKVDSDVDVDSVLSRLDELEATIIGLVEDSEGNILVAIDTAAGTIQTDLNNINAKITSIEGSLVTIETDISTIQVDLSSIDASITATNGKIVTIETALGTIQTDLSSIDASITATNGKIVTIETALGTIQTDLSSINGKLVALKDEMVTIGTDIDEFTVSLEEINTKIEVTNGKVAMIETDVGTIKGLITSVDGGVATIQTDIGTMKGTLSTIENHTHLQPATVGLSILAAIAAIAAAVMILRKVYLK